MAEKGLKAKGKKPLEADENRPTKPKKLSKAGEWRKAHPGGVIKILDMRAVMK